MDGGPVYVDLLEVAAVTEARLADAIIPGARVVMKSGLCLYTVESPDAVWEEVHRAHTSDPPPVPKMKMGDSAPAAEVNSVATGGFGHGF